MTSFGNLTDYCGVGDQKKNLMMDCLKLHLAKDVKSEQHYVHACVYD